MKFIQFTDIHLTRPGDTIGGRDPNENFELALQHALENHADAEALIITGDLSDWGEREDYLRLKDRSGTLPFPIHLCIGNHDDRDTFLSVFPEYADENGFVQSTFPLAGGLGIAIDTWGPDTHAGHFCEVRRDWLETQITATTQPTWIFMHHNPAPTRLAPMDSIMLRDAEAFGELISRHREKINHIFFGHCHLPLSGSFHGIPMSAPRGTNHAGWPNYQEAKLLSASDLPEAYAVAFAAPASVVVQMVEFGYKGEVRVEGSPEYSEWNRTTTVR